MTDKIILVTPPDDIALDGKRILAVNLTQEQQQILSESLKKVNDDKNIIVYIWNDQDTDWLFDKKPKADSIFFNSESNNELLVGYMAAQPNSYYFGSLRSLHMVNNSAIYSVDQCVDIISR